jgi:transposase
LSTKVERSQIEWRRSKVAELDSQGHSQPEIARILQISIGTVNRETASKRKHQKGKKHSKEARGRYQLL